ncbi:MAG: SufS family cysteine desulfurase, partial [Pirellulaceae bacterium]
MSTTERLVLNAQEYREDFPILHRRANSGAPLIFLDNAASTQRPRQVIDSISDCYTNYYANVHRGIHTLSEASTDRYEEARRVTGAFLNASSIREIIFTAGTTAAINAVARAWGDANVGKGDVILLTMMEHHANIVPWHQLSERTGCRIVFAPLIEDGRVDDAALIQLLEEHAPRLKLFAFTAVSNVLGTVNPVAKWTAAAHDAGALALVDAAQAAPHQPIDVQAWDADFVVFSGHKVCGPTGIGVLYGRERLLDAMPPFLGGGSMIETVTTAGFTSAALPYKFEAGTPPIAEAIGLAEAIRYLQKIGLDKIHDYEQQLLRRVHAGLSDSPGVRVLGPAVEFKGGIISFVIDTVHAHDIAHALDHRGIAVRAGHHCTMPLHKALGLTSSTRASFYFYNTPDEADALV